MMDKHSPAFLKRLAGFFSDRPGTCLLFSGGKKATRSFLTLFPTKTLTLKNDAEGFSSLRETFSGNSEGRDVPKWVGYFSYEFGALCDDRKRIQMGSSSFPLAHFVSCACIFIYSHEKKKLEVHFSGDKPLNEEEVFWLSKIQKQDYSFLEEWKKPISSLRLVQYGEKKEVYLEKIAEIKRRIREGAFYQVNLSHEFLFTGEHDPFDLFLKLDRKNPAPFSAFFCGDKYALVSSSPERLIRKRGPNLHAQPIKGTSPRMDSSMEDARQKAFLIESEKERAELLMITDLLRNDLYKIAKPGSVTVEKLFAVESYANVHHMHSEICASSNKDPFTIFCSLFPGGSVTGCPKLKSMEAIYELEGRSRKIYTGSMGYFAENGDFDFNICIRTLLCEKNRVSTSLGGAIVWDSDPEKEYEETLLKGKSIFEVLQ